MVLKILTQFDFRYYRILDILILGLATYPLQILLGNQLFVFRHTDLNVKMNGGMGSALPVFPL